MSCLGRGLTIAVLVLSLNADASDMALKPFTSDACSMFPESSAITKHDWCECCFAHDIAYWRGGTFQQRLSADQALRACVHQATGNRALAMLMYQGVRVGGSAYFPTNYRWAYGWPPTRNYEALTSAEFAAAEALLANDREQIKTATCPNR